MIKKSEVEVKKSIKEEGEVDWLGTPVKIANMNPYKLNEEGKRDLAQSIVDNMPIKELNKFIKEHGYKK